MGEGLRLEVLVQRAAVLARCEGVFYAIRTVVRWIASESTVLTENSLGKPTLIHPMPELTAIEAVSV